MEQRSITLEDRQKETQMGYYFLEGKIFKVTFGPAMLGWSHRCHGAVEDQLLLGRQERQTSSPPPLHPLHFHRLHPHCDDWLLDHVQVPSSHHDDPPTSEDSKCSWCSVSRVFMLIGRVKWVLTRRSSLRA